MVKWSQLFLAFLSVAFVTIAVKLFATVLGIGQLGDPLGWSAIFITVVGTLGGLLEIAQKLPHPESLSKRLHQFRRNQRRLVILLALCLLAPILMSGLYLASALGVIDFLLTPISIPLFMVIIMGVLISALLRSYRFRLKLGRNIGKWRVNNPILRNMHCEVGHVVEGGAWEIALQDAGGQGIYGPYIPSLEKGQYRAIFSLKIDENWGDHNLGILDVAYGGGKTYIEKPLKSSDFAHKNHYERIYLDFTLNEDMENVEFRVRTNPKEKRLLTFDYVALYKIGWRSFFTPHSKV